MRIIFLQGLTGSGKSDLAERMRLQGESAGVRVGVFNCDSVQCYKELEIGAAKPSKALRSLDSYRLFDWVDLSEKLTAGGYLKEFHSTLARSTFDLVMVVGGSGFYFWALETGMGDTPPPSEETQELVESLWKKEGADGLYRELAKRDPDLAHRLHSHDIYRLRRALEISFEKEKKPQGHLALSPLRPDLKIFLDVDRVVLKDRLSRRAEMMVSNGLIAEVQGYLERGLSSENCPALRTIGYKEIEEGLNQNWDERQMIEAIVQHSMQLAKKQRTWSARFPDALWVRGDSMIENIGFKDISNWLKQGGFRC